MQKLLSIITPTYNYGHLIHRLLDSILQQTYNNIEMFVIDDGSTDNTKRVVEGYIGKFQERGFKLKYIYQKNQRQAVAINSGLKLITGDYLVWPDADDEYAEPTALELMANTLDATDDEVSSCRSLAYYVDENFRVVGKTRHNKPEQLFIDCLFAKNFVFTPGLTMVKKHILFNEIDNKTIYTGNNFPGQNFQILLPIFYKYKTVIINKFLLNILATTNSDSRKQLSYDSQLERNQMRYDMLENTLKRIKGMPDKEKKSFIEEIKVKSTMHEIMIHCFFIKKKEVRRVYKQMLTENMLIPKKIKICYRLSFVPAGYILLRVLRKILYVCKLK